MTNNYFKTFFSIVILFAFHQLMFASTPILPSISLENAAMVDGSDCYAGDLQTIGTVIVCPGDTFHLEAINDTIPCDPTNGDYTWRFSDVLGGTGGLTGGFTIIGASPTASWNNDLNGILSFNGLGVLKGKWVIHGAVASDENNATGTVCSITADSLIVDFSTLDLVSLTDNGDMSATVVAEGGTEPYNYLWSDGQTTQTATNLENDMIFVVTVTDTLGCSVVDSILMANICSAGVLITTGEVTLGCEIDSFHLANDSTENVPIGGGYGWYFDNTYTDGTGALNGTFIFSGIGTPPSNTYNNDLNGVLSNNNLDLLEGTWVLKGASYEDSNNTFNSICHITEDSLIVHFSTNTLEVTIVDNGDLTATANATGGDGVYSYLWDDGQTDQTAVGLADGQTISVVVSDTSGCDATASITVLGPLTCNAGVITTTGEIGICDDESFDLQNDGNHEVPEFGGYGWVFDNTFTDGTGALEGLFILSGIDDPTTTFYDYDLNGLLSGNSLPLFEGTWTIKGAVYSDGNDAFNSICNITTDSLVVTFSESPTITATETGDGEATAEATGGNPPYNYVWSDGQTTDVATELPVGNHTVTVTDANGCEATTSVDIVVGINVIPALDRIEIFPNPTNGHFSINLELNTSEMVNIEILDALGRTILNTEPNVITNDVFDINLKNKAEGIYMVKMNIGEKVLVRKIVLNN